MRTAALCLGSERMCPQVRTTRRHHGALAQFVSAYSFGRPLIKPGQLGDSAWEGPAGRAVTRAATAAAAAAATAASSAAGAASHAADGAGHPSGANGRSAGSSSGQPFMGAEYFPEGEFSIDFQVRDYELDQFGVVNNAVYSSYFQHARHEAFAVLGHEVDDFARKGNPLALSSMVIAFRAPLRTRDRFRVTVSVAKISGARCVMHQRILRRLTARELQEAQQQQQQAAGTAGGGATSPAAAEQLVAEADATVVFLDAAYRPARMPRDIFKLFTALHDMQAAAASARAAQAEARTPASGPAAATATAAVL